MIESGGQLEEYDILIRGCDIIIEKLKVIKENVNQEQYGIVITENNSMILEIQNEDYTCGGPINYNLQNLEEVIFSGITNPDFMQKNINIKFKVKKEFKPIDIFNKAVDNTEKIFLEIKKKIINCKEGKVGKVSKESKENKENKENKTSKNKKK